MNTFWRVFLIALLAFFVYVCFTHHEGSKTVKCGMSRQFNEIVYSCELNFGHKGDHWTKGKWDRKECIVWENK